jgi:transglutaminase-like putative cysteine protease
MARAVRIAIRSIVAVVLAVIPSAAVHSILQATGPLAAVATWAGAFSVVLVLASEIEERRVLLKWLAVGLAAFGALVLIADMVIIPLSAYLLWFELVPVGNARGAVSFVYVMLVAYGSALVGASITRRPLIALAAYVAWLSFLSIPIVPRAETLIILPAAALVLVVAGVARGRPFRGALRAGTHAVVLLGIALVAGVALGGATTARGSRFVDHVMSPGLRQMIVTIVPNFPIMYDIPGYGYRMPTENLGRSPVLSNRALFHVTGLSSEPVYLRTEVFHVYRGSSWSVSSSLEAAAADVSLRAAREPGGAVFLRGVDQHEDEPDDELTPSLPARQMGITILADFYSVVPHTLDTQAIAISGREQVRFRRSGETLGYHLTDPLLYDDRITLYRENVVRIADGVDDVYLDVSDATREELAALAAELRGATDSQTIVNTLRYLRDGFEYTLEPPHSAPGRFVSDFLNEHQRGYCVHFATAFTLLSRLQGIPARYVTGFRVQPPIPDEMGIPDMMMYDSVTVTGYSAHAWAEIWLPDVGWRIVEATPPMQPVGYENTFFDQYEGIRNEGRTVMQLQEILRRDVREVRDEPGMLLRLPSLPVWLALVPFVALVVVAGIRMRRSRDIGRRFRSTVRRLRNRSVRAGFPPPERVGWTGWAQSPVGHTDRVASVVLAVCFGERAPSRRDVRFLRHWGRWHLPRRTSAHR